MTQFLPPNLLALFKARDPIPFLPPVDKLPHEKRTAGYTGIAEFVNQFEDPATTPAPVKIKTKEERKAEKRQQKAEATAYKLEQDIALWRPGENPNATVDPYKTLFVARINYDTSEAKLRREFEMYGPVKKIAVAHDLDRKPRGYAFIEYDRERDMRSAYKHADGKKIEGKRVLVDVERGRTIKGWLPRRLGGGLGGTRRGGPDVNLKHSGREENRNEDRYMERERERPEKPERRRSRSRSRDRGRAGRDRHRSDRHKRDRSRDRERNRDLAQAAGSADVKMDVSSEGASVPEPPPRKERRRSRSRDRKRRRSRSRDRERKRRDHDRTRDRGDRESRREHGADREERVASVKEEVKDEPSEPQQPMQDNFNSAGYEGEYNYNNGENNAYDPY